MVAMFPLITKQNFLWIPVITMQYAYVNGRERNDNDIYYTSITIVLSFIF